MNAYQNDLTKLLEVTEEVYRLAKAVDTKMEHNGEGQLETLQLLFEKRQKVIQQLAGLIQRQDFQWTERDKKTISRLKNYETLLQPLVRGLHRSFAMQMNRISQTKQASRKYIGAYQNMTTEGSFIDKRK
ncbi:flagellar protein FliT [Paenisporosarcina indica]|uniref:flagellar protein FliT n=1 Tax=Paenisporosarcina indica TaxID=650093 RepID=UPI00094FDD71|nr:flagellar protein FliT [Paenisporosarcina indica]